MSAYLRGPALTLLLCGVASLGACGNENPVSPRNRNPVISSILFFPQTIGPSDSLIVICNAADPDGDSLVYDWITDASLRIKDAPSVVYIYNTSSNSRIFYYGNPPSLPDTAWIRCYVRDGRGGVDARMFFPILQ